MGRHSMRSAHAPSVIDGPGIACVNLTKNFGDVAAVQGLTFDAPMAAVTGFVGANGAGKSTTMRILLGLAEPSRGAATIAGRRLRLRYATPGNSSGPFSTDRGRTQARPDGRIWPSRRLPTAYHRRRVDEVLEVVGLEYAADRRSGGYSLGMRQRLSLATALLGDPPILVLDEPTKGLDPPGIIWLRQLLRGLADEGRCVFVSSHHLSELEAIADRVVMLDRGRLVAHSSLGDLLSMGASATVIDGPDRVALEAVIVAHGGEVSRDTEDGRLRVTGLSAQDIGEHVARSGLVLHWLADERNDLEEVYQGLTDRLSTPQPVGTER